MSIIIDRILAAAPTTERGRPSKLSADPKGEQLAYASGKSIFLRSIDNPSLSKQYTSHIAQTTVAQFSPSGYYVASGDVTGTVKVWDSVEANITKGEYQIISGRINDIAWDGDSQRIIAVGDGRERFGRCILADSGNSVGEITGHSSIINAVSIRKQRPLRAATVADDCSLIFLHGPPFRYADKIGNKHNRYIYDVQFSPDGNKLVSVGADRMIHLYDGKTAVPKMQIGKDEHKGSIFGVSWASDSKRIVTASADQTVKLWDIETGKSLQTWKFGEENCVSIADHQVGVVWPASRNDGLIISLNLAGDLIYLVEGTENPIKTIQGHNKSITTMGSSVSSKGQNLFTGSFDGRVCAWDMSSYAGSTVQGECHKSQIIAFQTTSDKLYSAGWDDKLRIADICGKRYVGDAVSISAQPKGLASAEGRVFVVTCNGVDIFTDDKLVASLPIKNFNPTAIAAVKSLVAVGNDKNMVQIYTVGEDHQLSLHKELSDSQAGVVVLSFCEDGSLLAACNTMGKIIVYETSSWSVQTNRWSAHTARVMSFAWNSTGTHAVSGGLDNHVYVWSLKSPGKRIQAQHAHKDGVYGVSWADGDKRIVSTGGDATLKIWDVLDLD